MVFNENELFGFEKFIEALFILAMLDNLKVDLNDSAKIIHRIHGFHHIRKDIQPKCTSFKTK